MTPLAFQIAKEITLPLKRRNLRDGAGLLQRMDDIHCFEISAVLPIIEELAAHVRVGKIDERTSFLPAPRTWLEVQTHGSSLGWYLEERGADKLVAGVSSAFYHKGSHFGTTENGYLRLGEGTAKQTSYVDEIAGQDVSSFILAALAVINTPRIIGRVTHAPHKGLQRRLLSMRGAIGNFPLHAWTEIQLKISDPESTDETGEAHYTGERALHFCRAHLRVRYGRLEIVRGHWRGDVSLGIKQSRYKVGIG